SLAHLALPEPVFAWQASFNNAVPGRPSRLKHVLFHQDKDTHEPFCRVSLITSSKEEEELLRTSNKPAVKLLYNRRNNRYPYSSSSDDKLLKNLELFDQLSLRYNGRILFMKAVTGDEVCCWSFYAHGCKTAKVCCAPVTCASGKKETKVDFPETGIYEEIWNILRFKPRDGRGPNNALPEATGGAARCSPHLDEEKPMEGRSRPFSSSERPQTALPPASMPHSDLQRPSFSPGALERLWSPSRRLL
ncbi:BTB/POZ domain-containing adapter for CUL3-mediated RhoA degradation protein 3, partial [Galemys pyrenaicus]